MSKIRVAITIYADFDECETRGIRLGNMMMQYSEGDISRLDIMREAIHDLTQMYNEELAQFLGKVKNSPIEIMALQIVLTRGDDL